MEHDFNSDFPNFSFKDWKIAEGNRLYCPGPEAMSLIELLAYLIRDYQYC